MNSGASFADIGCGYGLSTMIIAETFPNAKVCGYDIHGPSIDEAKKLSLVNHLIKIYSYNHLELSNQQK